MGGNQSRGTGADSTRVANANSKQNPSLSTSSGVDFHPRAVGSPWHAQDIGVGKILGLQGRTLTNTSHMNLGMESFRSKPMVERTPVISVHTPPNAQVLPPGPVDATVDFTGLRGEITAGTPTFGRGGGSGGGHGGQSGFGGGNGLASADIRDLMKNKHNYTGWARHGGVDPADGLMPIAAPAYYEQAPMQKVQIKQQFPKRVSNASAQGFFD
tara:strand:- start:8446 stop:9084 length:639 start_codon:yes stop_codon:yes gene_type:complete